MSVWKYVKEKESHDELHTNVADFYHECRPRYPAKLMQHVSSILPLHAKILEIGSGPGTATLPLLQQGYNVTCVEPGSGMIARAKDECREHIDDMNNQVSFHQVTLQQYLEQNDESCGFDAITAAASFHWAMGDSEGQVVKQCHEVLKPNGKLILMWNLPPEPSVEIQNAVAAHTNRDVPFCFGGYSLQQHVMNSTLR